MNIDTLPQNPFGEECCEHERETYKSSYPNYTIHDQEYPALPSII